MKVFAAIDVGSYELAMKIFQISAKGGIEELDHIRHRIELGTDTFKTGKISLKNMNELCEVLKDFSAIMSSYKVDAYRAYGTSAMRESENTNSILDQIKNRTGLNVSVISNSEQRFLEYKALATREDVFNEMIQRETAVADIGGGSLQVSLFDKDSLHYNI